MVEARTLSSAEVVSLKERLRFSHLLLERTCAELALSIQLPQVEFDGKHSLAKEECDGVTEFARDVAISAASYAVSLAAVLETPRDEWPLHPNLSPEVFAGAAEAAEKYFMHQVTEHSLSRGKDG